MHRFIILLTAVVIALGIGGCGGGSTSADPLATDSITVANVSIGRGGSVSLTATVTNASGKAVVGRKVNFVTVRNQSGAASILSSENTDNNGKATIPYIAGVANGVDVVRASISNGNFGDIIITVGSGIPVGLQIIISGSPTTVSAGQSSILTATVTDAAGNLVSGQAVAFSITSNQSGALLATLNSGITDASGSAVAVYTAGANTPASIVQDVVAATIAGSTSSAVIITRTAAGASPPAGYSLSIAANVTSLTASQNAVVTATVTDGSGNFVGGQAVVFSITSNQSGALLATLNGGITDASGRAVAVYTAGANTSASSVQDVVAATIAGSTSNAVIITRTSAGASPPAGYSLSIAANVTSLTASQNTVVTATVTDGSGSPVGGQTVTFTLLNNNSGALLNILNGGTTDSSGRAVAVYTAGGATGTTTVQDVIQASVLGSAGAIVMTRTVAGGGGGATGFSMTVVPTPASLLAGQQSVIVATVKNADSTPAAGQTVTFSFLGGGATGPSGATLSVLNSGKTDANGEALAMYTAGSLTTSIDIQDVVTAQVTGTIGAAIITRSAVPSTGLKGYSITSFGGIPATSWAQRFSTFGVNNCMLKATVANAYTGSIPTPYNDIPVTFSIFRGPGTLPAVNTVLTDTNGEAYIFFDLPVPAAGNETVVQATIPPIAGQTTGGDTVAIIYW